MPRPRAMRRLFSRKHERSVESRKAGRWERHGRWRSGAPEATKAKAVVSPAAGYAVVIESCQRAARYARSALRVRCPCPCPPSYDDVTYRRVVRAPVCRDVAFIRLPTSTIIRPAAGAEVLRFAYVAPFTSNMRVVAMFR